jgi:hypothetical protein
MFVHVEMGSAEQNEAKCKYTQKMKCVDGRQSGGDFVTPRFRLDYLPIPLLVALWTEGFTAGESRAAV